MAAPYYADDHVTLYLGDWREHPEWLAADVLVTDPPYGVDYRSGWARELVWGGRYAQTDGAIGGDVDTFERDEVLGRWGAERAAVVFGSLRAPLPPGWRQALCWDKGDASGMGDLSIPWKPSFELLFLLGRTWGGDHRRTSGVLRSEVVSRLSMGRLHPHEKPLALLRRVIGKCPPGVVADPFAGAGSTLRAAKDLGRQAIGVEMVERYAEMTARRCAQEVLPVAR